MKPASMAMWLRNGLKVRCLQSGTTLRRISTKSCESKVKTRPIDESAKVLRHLHFSKQMPFKKGIDIQERFVKAQLDIKELHAKIRRRTAQLQQEKANANLNDNERQILDRILNMKPNPIILTFEFQPTYTGGKRIKKLITEEQISRYEEFCPSAQKNNMKPKFVQVERGGQVTFHGPGQVVAYIILDLKTFKDFPAKCFVSSIENATINALRDAKGHDDEGALDVRARKTDQTGVWVTDKKIASIGVHVRRSITSHGVCINVCPDLSYLNSFEMCGLPNSLATSVKELRPASSITTKDIAVSFVNELAKVIGIDVVERAELDDIEL
ncbi:hypothetical protein HG536_0C00480 [Torulaspora globosa]|uniref:Octanoyltransferase n=1 Tax=Torulaspora globosa TaxID=48254 RepID=A0A7G3ZEE5_9SACH|nr:uncharacterized protein HG536_0C00480 [Torulaspora globosa]QLL31881.1 hypothetical protein HG536_0C00480 [Torulaspora globosa]